MIAKHTLHSCNSGCLDDDRCVSSDLSRGWSDAFIEHGGHRSAIDCLLKQEDVLHLNTSARKADDLGA